VKNSFSVPANPLKILAKPSIPPNTAASAPIEFAALGNEMIHSQAGLVVRTFFKSSRMSLLIPEMPSRPDLQ
jgi:hypothetical protein